MASKFAARLKKIAMGFLVTFLILCLLEGLCSFAIFVKDLFTTTSRPLAERVHTRYDADLGWVNVPGTTVRDMYGPGLGLRINSLGFRGAEVTAKTPPGKVRIVCSGDSFTLGYGVDDDHTWVKCLADQDARIETVNMGQGGYGVDQAFLWYRRERETFEHQAHLFTVIANDFERMRRTDFHGYGKPRLKIEGDQLAVEGTPVSRRAFYVPWLTQNAAAFDDVKIFRVLGSLVRRVAPARGADELNDAQTRAAAAKLFQELRDLHRGQKTTLVLCYLPARKDLESRKMDPWREFLHEQADKLGVSLVDMTDELIKLPASDVDALFIQEDIMGFPQASGHYNNRGNQVVAQRLYRRLAEIPELANLLKDRPTAAPATDPAAAATPASRAAR